MLSFLSPFTFSYRADVSLLQVVAAVWLLYATAAMPGSGALACDPNGGARAFMVISALFFLLDALEFVAVAYHTHKWAKRMRRDVAANLAAPNGTTGTGDVEGVTSPTWPTTLNALAPLIMWVAGLGFEVGMLLSTLIGTLITAAASPGASGTCWALLPGVQWLVVLLAVLVPAVFRYKAGSQLCRCCRRGCCTSSKAYLDVRVVHWNTQRGTGVYDHNDCDYKRTADCITCKGTTQPDFVTLQEAGDNTGGQQLAEMTGGMHDSSDNNEIRVLSRRPIERVYKLSVPRAWGERGEAVAILSSVERDGVVVPMVVASTHLGYQSNLRQQTVQLLRVAKWVEAIVQQESAGGPRIPAVITGDMNSPAEALAAKVMRWEGWTDAFRAAGRGYGLSGAPSYSHSRGYRDYSCRRKYCVPHYWFRLDQLFVPSADVSDGTTHLQSCGRDYSSFNLSDHVMFRLHLRVRARSYHSGPLTNPNAAAGAGAGAGAGGGAGDASVSPGAVFIPPHSSHGEAWGAET